MKIFATGDVIHLDKTSNITRVTLARVVGLINSGSNNGDNSFGWCGLKAVINFEDLIYVLDFPEAVKITTNDNLLVAEGTTAWNPSTYDLEKFDLLLFDKDDY